MIRARWIKADGTTEEVFPANGVDFSLAELQKFVGGYAEHIALTRIDSMFVDEDGRAKNLPINWNATEEYNRYSRGGFILGDVLVCERSMVR